MPFKQNWNADLACLNEIPENEVLKRVMNVLHEHGLNEIEQ